MKTYTLLTKPYKIQLRFPSHKMKHGLTFDRWIDFKRNTEMWCCKVKQTGKLLDHKGGISLMVFTHSWMTTFKLESKALTEKWQVKEDSKGDWTNDMKVLIASYENLNIMNTIK